MRTGIFSKKERLLIREILEREELPKKDNYWYVLKHRLTTYFPQIAMDYLLYQAILDFIRKKIEEKIV